MRCRKCGTLLRNDSLFCTHCGLSVNGQINYGERLLKCESCGGSLNIGEKENILFCPYCGSKKLIIESDAVKIKRLDNTRWMARDEKMADVEKHRIDAEYKSQIEKTDSETNYKMIKAFLIFCFVVFIFCIIYALALR